MLVIHGDISHPMFRAVARVLADGVPNAQLRQLAGSGHVTYAEQPEQYARAVTESVATDRRRWCANGQDELARSRRGREVKIAAATARLLPICRLRMRCGRLAYSGSVAPQGDSGARGPRQLRAMPHVRHRYR